MIGTAGLQGLRVECIVGIHPHERETPQPVLLDLSLEYDFAAAAAEDGIAHAVDYTRAASLVTELAKRRGFQLIETMAEEMAAALLAGFPQVQRVRLEIRKPAAMAAAACAFVRLERTRS